jgi:hypothetical protein
MRFIDKIINIIQNTFNLLDKNIRLSIPNLVYISNLNEGKNTITLINLFGLEFPIQHEFNDINGIFYPKYPTDSIPVHIYITQSQKRLIIDGFIGNGLFYKKLETIEIGKNDDFLSIKKLEEIILKSEIDITFYLKSVRTVIPETLIEFIENCFEELYKKLKIIKKDIYFSQPYYPQFQSGSEILNAIFGNKPYNIDLEFWIEICRHINNFIIVCHLNKKENNELISEYITSEIPSDENSIEYKNMLKEIKKFIFSQEQKIIQTLENL